MANLRYVTCFIVSTINDLFFVSFSISAFVSLYQLLYLHMLCIHLHTFELSVLFVYSVQVQ